MTPLLYFVCFIAVVSGYDEIKGRLQRIEEALEHLQYENRELRIENRNLRLLVESNRCGCELAPYNTTVEELEIRMERLEEDMFQAEVAIIEVETEVIEVKTEVMEVEAEISNLEISVNEIQYTLQETIETVLDHADNLDQLEQDVINLDTDTNGLENRTSDIERDVLNLEDDVQGIDIRILDLEQIQLEARDSAFFATLNSQITFETAHQTIPFDNVKINEGEHYNSTTGIYTAPVDGIYQFSWFIRASPKANSRFDINGAPYINPVEDTIEGTQGEGATVTVTLQAGHQVDVKTGNLPHTVYGYADDSWFGGHLLFPDDLEL